MPKEQMQGTDTLRQLSNDLLTELTAANRRLSQPISPADVTSAIRLVADRDPGTCILIQPGHSAYHWSDRTIPIVFLVRLNDSIRIRVRRARSYRNSMATPAFWPELRAFPKGDAEGKLRKWAEAFDGVTVKIDDARKLPSLPIECNVSEWQVSLPFVTP